jgi:beta-N-acetylhexosaminidase
MDFARWLAGLARGTVAALLLALPASCGGATAASGQPAATPSATPLCTNQSALALWSTNRLAWQVVAVPVQLTSVDTVRAEVAAGAGGIILFGSAAPANLAAQLKALSALSPGGIAPLVMSDIEGGDVERAANLLGPMPSARQLAQTMTPGQVRAFAFAAGKRMRAIGITMDLAPVMDLDAGFGPSASDPDGTRSFSDDPQVAAADAGAFASGLAAAGVVAVGKHFPGLHGAGDNTDLVPASTASWSALQQRGLVPFRAAISSGIPAIMLSNASVPGLTSLPSSLSPEVVHALRDGLGFNGLILTDSLTAGAISSTGLTVPQSA